MSKIDFFKIHYKFIKILLTIKVSETIIEKIQLRVQLQSGHPDKLRIYFHFPSPSVVRIHWIINYFKISSSND